jgi:hypothetical protein
MSEEWRIEGAKKRRREEVKEGVVFFASSILRSSAPPPQVFLQAKRGDSLRIQSFSLLTVSKDLKNI